MLCLYDKYIQSDITKKSFNTRYLYTQKRTEKKIKNSTVKISYTPVKLFIELN